MCVCVCVGRGGGGGGGGEVTSKSGPAYSKAFTLGPFMAECAARSAFLRLSCSCGDNHIHYEGVPVMLLGLSVGKSQCVKFLHVCVFFTCFCFPTMCVANFMTTEAIVLC